MRLLVFVGGISVGALHHVMQKDGNCSLYNNNTMKIITHAFWECPHISKAWNRYNTLQDTARLNFLTSWSDVLCGPLNLDITNTIELSHSVKVSSDTLWMILRKLILWNIRYNKCSFDVDQGPYHTGLVFYKEWKTTIHIDMDAWKELQ